MSKKEEEFNFSDYDHKSMSEFWALYLINRYSHLFEPQDRQLSDELYGVYAKKYNTEIFELKKE